MWRAGACAKRPRWPSKRTGTPRLQMVASTKDSMNPESVRSLCRSHTEAVHTKHLCQKFLQFRVSLPERSLARSSQYSSRKRHCSPQRIKHLTLRPGLIGPAQERALLRYVAFHHRQTVIGGEHEFSLILSALGSVVFKGNHYASLQRLEPPPPNCNSKRRDRGQNRRNERDADRPPTNRYGLERVAGISGVD
jgi:hypothetical protein